MAALSEGGREGRREGGVLLEVGETESHSKEWDCGEGKEGGREGGREGGGVGGRGGGGEDNEERGS